MLDGGTTGPALGVARSLGGRRWVWRDSDARAAAAIAQRHAVPEIVARVLAGRGVDAELAAHFLQPTLRALLPDPSRLADMDTAADRLARAVSAAETVAVFGDYDVDGACSAALMVSFLRMLGCTVLPYVPDRSAEGYGPNAPALRRLADRGATLFVCVDCGTAAAAVFATIAGRADVIVLDHHKTDDVAPPILATVNPNQLECRSGFTYLCAAALAFLAVVATVRSLRRGGYFAARAEPDLRGLLDLVALATVCDMMPLIGPNRALVRQGLKVMARRARPGLAALLEIATSRVPSAVTCGFGLGPRINAGGRIGEADLGLRLLLCEDAGEARALASKLDAVNRQRQIVEAAMLDRAMLQAAEQVDAGFAVLMVCGAEWHPGVVGIVAGRIKERFNRPACVGGIAAGIVKGSGRSVSALDLGAAVIRARQTAIIETGGGHAMAAGFTLREARIAEFHAFLDECLAAARELPAAADLGIDGTVAVTGGTAELAGALERLAPFGNGNDEPMLVLPRVRVVRADRVGRDATTVRAFVVGEDGRGRLKAMMFRAADGPAGGALLGLAGVPIHLAGHLRAEAWNGAVAPCFAIRDVALA